MFLQTHEILGTFSNDFVDLDVLWVVGMNGTLPQCTLKMLEPSESSSRDSDGTRRGGGEADGTDYYSPATEKISWQNL